MSSAERQSGKISRVTFNRAFRSVYDIVTDVETEEAYGIFNNYFKVVIDNLEAKQIDRTVITKPAIFSAFIVFFLDVARRVHDKFDSEYTVDNFSTLLDPFFKKLNMASLKKGKASRLELVEAFKRQFNSSFSLKK